MSDEQDLSRNDMAHMANELQRRSGHAAKKHAERVFSRSCGPATVSVTMRFWDPGDGTEDHETVTCQGYCESQAEGPSDEAGDRSHAQGAHNAFVCLGAGYGELECHLERVRKHPSEYRIVWTHLKELMPISS